jgi:hypothetical protein
VRPADRRRINHSTCFRFLHAGILAGILWEYGMWVEPSKQVTQPIWLRRTCNLVTSAKDVELAPNVKRILRLIDAEFAVIVLQDLRLILHKKYKRQKNLNISPKRVDFMLIQVRGKL